MEKLREEILQSERVRSDLLKWKLGLVGVVGAAGLGFSGTDTLRRADLVLCIIAPVCVYVDLLCQHLTLKMLVIGRFLESLGSSTDPTMRAIARYEAYVRLARKFPLGERGRTMSAFALEEWALSGSTFVLSLALVGYGIFLWSGFSIPFIASGVAGIVATVLGTSLYRRRFKGVQALPIPDAEVP